MRRNVRYRKKSTTTKVTTSYHRRTTTTATTATTKIRTRRGKIRKRTDDDGGGGGGRDDINNTTRISTLCQSQATAVLAEPCRTSIIIPMSVMMNDSYNVTSHSILNGDNNELIFSIIDTLTELVCSKTSIAVRRFPEDTDQCLLYNNNKSTNNVVLTADDNDDPIPIIAFSRNKSLFDAYDHDNNSARDNNDNKNKKQYYSWIQLWWKYDVIAIDHRQPYDGPIITHHEHQQRQHDTTRRLEQSLQRFVNRRLSNGAFLSLLRRNNKSGSSVSSTEIIRDVSPLGHESRVFSHVIYMESHNHPTGHGMFIAGWILLFTSLFFYCALLCLGRRKRLTMVETTKQAERDILLAEDSLKIVLDASRRYMKLMEDDQKDDLQWRRKSSMTLDDFRAQKDDDEITRLTVDTETRLTVDS